MSSEVSATGFDAARFLSRFGHEGHNGLIGLRYVSHDADHVALAVPFQGNLATGAEGGLAEGVVLTLLDMTATVSVWTRVGRFRPHATIELRMDHLTTPQAGEELVARAECHTIQGQVAYVRGWARNSAGAEVATMAATYMFTDRE